jgi:hypothetical protein
MWCGKIDWIDVKLLILKAGGFEANFKGKIEVCQRQGGADWPLCWNHGSFIHK